MENVLDVLRERGFVQQVSDEEQLHALVGREAITLYWGYDATASSLHIGNLMSIMMLAWFQRFGHRPIALAGGGTTLIGDPSMRITSRPMLGQEQIAENLRSIERQIGAFLDYAGGRALALNNAEWLTKLNFIAFMRDIGSRFSVNDVLRLEAYRTRLEAGGLTFLELSYVLMQSYDFLHLYQTYGCVLQVGGSEQWGNSVQGADLIRRVTGGEAYVLVTPLVMNAEGTKMGKTATGAVWLDAQLTSPYEYYQYWRNTDDRDVERFLAIYTFLPLDEVRALGTLHGAELNQAKEVLAFEATKLLHGEAAAAEARDAARSLFAGGGSTENIPTTEIACDRLAEGMPVTELFKTAGLVTSANEARNLIAQNGLAINGEPVADPRARIDLEALNGGALTLSRGRKRHMRVVCR